jgi:hypothetical protein
MESQKTRDEMLSWLSVISTFPQPSWLSVVGVLNREWINLKLKETRKKTRSR